MIIGTPAAGATTALKSLILWLCGFVELHALPYKEEFRCFAEVHSGVDAAGFLDAGRDPSEDGPASLDWAGITRVLQEATPFDVFVNAKRRRDESPLGCEASHLGHQGCRR